MSYIAKVLRRVSTYLCEKCESTAEVFFSSLTWFEKTSRGLLSCSRWSEKHLQLTVYFLQNTEYTQSPQVTLLTETFEVLGKQKDTIRNKFSGVLVDLKVPGWLSCSLKSFCQGRHF